MLHVCKATVLLVCLRKSVDWKVFDGAVDARGANMLTSVHDESSLQVSEGKTPFFFLLDALSNLDTFCFHKFRKKIYQGGQREPSLTSNIQEEKTGCVNCANWELRTVQLPGYYVSS